MIAFSIACLLLVAGAGFAVEFSYDSQGEWPGICVSGNQNTQSPIDIVSAEFDDDLMDLVMSGWGVEYQGTFSNTGHNLQFDPTTPGQATTTNHLGTFEVLQFHMHWGVRTGTGSEHLVSGEARELEIHFVHRKRNNDDSTAFDALSVVAVMAEVDEDADLAGPWSQLDASQVPMNQDSINISGFQFDSLLPDKLEYYYYRGSLTTPTCDETVAWFVLRDTIKIPGAYLQQLRQVRGTDGQVLGLNFRQPQDLGEREVTTNSQAMVRPTLSFLLFSLVLIGLFYC